VSPIGYLPGRSLERRIEDLLDTTRRFICLLIDYQTYPPHHLSRSS
jgi:hypothetical protein